MHTRGSVSVESKVHIPTYFSEYLSSVTHSNIFLYLSSVLCTIFVSCFIFILVLRSSILTLVFPSSFNLGISFYYIDFVTSFFNLIFECPSEDETNTTLLTFRTSACFSLPVLHTLHTSQKYEDVKLPSGRWVIPPSTSRLTRRRH